MTSAQYREYVKSGRVPNDTSAVRAADLERNSESKSPAKNAIKKDHSQCYRVSVHCRRAKATDSEGVSVKACLDGIVRSGLLPDDSRDYIPQTPTYTEEYTKDKPTRETVISVERIA